MNLGKMSPLSKTLTCLGITIDIDSATINIDKRKLKDIYQECIQVSHKKFLNRRKFQSLLGILCVRVCSVQNQGFSMARYRTSSRTSLQNISLMHLFMDLPVSLSLHNILVFLEYLYQSSLSTKVIKNYHSSLISKARQLGLNTRILFHLTVSKLLRSISINSHFIPTPRGVFDIPTLYSIYIACEQLTDPIYFGQFFSLLSLVFLRMSNMAPHS